MDESWISVLIMVAFFILPIFFGKGKKRKGDQEGKSLLEEIFSEVDFEQTTSGEEVFPDFGDTRESYRSPEVNVKNVKVPSKLRPDAEPVQNVEENEEKPQEMGLKRKGGMTKGEKKKLIIYSEVMSPKYKEY